MELCDIAQAIGIQEYPRELDATYAKLPSDNTPACDLTYIDKLQADYDTFGEYYGLVRETAIQINGDTLRSTWIKTALAYARGRSIEEISKIPTPYWDGSNINAMLPLYILVGLLPEGIAEYRVRGFSEEDIRRVMRRFWDALDIRKLQDSIPGINATYFGWLTIFVKARIFELEVLQFELRTAPNNAVYVKNKQTGQIVPFINQGMVHKSGEQMLGSVGYEDTNGAFEAKFYEDENNIYGYACLDCRIDTQLRAYPKAQWEVYLRPGDDMLSFHIPRGVDISPETVKQQFEKGRRIAKKRYPEHKGFDIYGSSWILDPSLNEIVRPDSKIAQLMQHFTRYPVKSDGNSVFSFVFDSKPADLHDLPEDSSLRRGLKKMYLEGRYNHIYAGITTDI